MVSRSELEHKICLENIIRNPKLMGEDRSDIETFLPEPIWFDDNNNMRKMCDLLIGYKNGIWRPVEVKAHKHAYALLQLESAEEYLATVLNKPLYTSKVVTYRPKIDYFEIKR